MQRYDSDTTVRSVADGIDATLHSTQVAPGAGWVVEVELHEKNGQKIGSTIELGDMSYPTLDDARAAGEAYARSVVRARG